jgi:hypothetical protein
LRKSAAFANANLPLPAINTIRTRLGRTNGRERMKKREGDAKAHDLYDPIKGTIPDAEWPLALVQMDHTLLPVIVDDVHRKSIRRAWITLAIDCNTRVCLGMHLSLDAPSAMSAGMHFPRDSHERQMAATSGYHQHRLALLGRDEYSAHGQCQGVSRRYAEIRLQRIRHRFPLAAG